MPARNFTAFESVFFAGTHYVEGRPQYRFICRNAVRSRNRGLACPLILASETGARAVIDVVL